MFKRIVSHIEIPFGSLMSHHFDSRSQEPNEVIEKILSISRSADLAKKTADTEVICPLSESLAQFYAIHSVAESTSSRQPFESVVNTSIEELLSKLRVAQNELVQKVACLEEISSLFQSENLFEEELNEKFQFFKASWDEIDELLKKEAQFSEEIHDQIQVLQNEFLKAAEPFVKDLETGQRIDPESFKPLFVSFENLFANLPKVWEFSVENQRLKEEKLLEVVDRVKSGVSAGYFSRKKALGIEKVKAQASSHKEQARSYSVLNAVDEVKIISRYHQLFKKGVKPERVYFLGGELFKFYALEGLEIGHIPYLDLTIKGTQELKEFHKTLASKLAELEEWAKRVDTTMTSTEGLDSLFNTFKGECSEVQESFFRMEKSSEEIFKELEDVQKAFVATLIDARSSSKSDDIKGALILFSPFLRHLPDFWAFNDEVDLLKALEVNKRLFEARKTFSDKYFLRKGQLLELLAKENEEASKRDLQAIAFDVQQFEVRVNEQLDKL